MPAGLLSDVERARAARFCRGADQRRFRAGKAHLRRLLSAYLSIPPKAVAFHRSPLGRPRLAGRSDLDFSVSHSENVLLVAVGVGPVGVDVEVVRPIPNLEAVTTHILTEEESGALADAPSGEQLTRFYRLWTAKEAVLKGLGVGLSYDPRGMALRPTVDGFVVRRSGGPGDGWRVVSLHFTSPDAHGEAIAAVAVPDRWGSDTP